MSPNPDDIFDTWDRIWGVISEMDKGLAVTCHEVCDLKKQISDVINDLGKLEGKYDEMIKNTIADARHKADRSTNIKIAIMGGIFGIITAVITIVPYLLK